MNPKNELDLLIVQRGVVVFRNQDFAKLGPQSMIDFGGYFGPLHVFPVGRCIPEFPELPVVYSGPEEVSYYTAGKGYAKGSKAEYAFLKGSVFDF